MFWFREACVGATLSRTLPYATTVHQLHAQTSTIIMSSGRTQGRRVLGTQKTQTLKPDPPPNRPHHSRNVSLLSPSESSISSQPSTPPTHDLAANVSLGQAAAASASSRLVCPICNEEMVRPGIAFILGIASAHANSGIDDTATAESVYTSQYLTQVQFLHLQLDTWTTPTPISK